MSLTENPSHRRRSSWAVSSREVSATAVYLHIAALLVGVGDWPLCGTPAWTALDDSDPRKAAALAYAALEFVLAEDIRQSAEVQASQDISAAAEWGVLGRRLAEHERFYREHPYLKSSHERH
jgi:hypothetical protein